MNAYDIPGAAPGAKFYQELTNMMTTVRSLKPPGYVTNKSPLAGGAAFDTSECAGKPGEHETLEKPTGAACEAGRPG